MKIATVTAVGGTMDTMLAVVVFFLVLVVLVPGAGVLKRCAFCSVAVLNWRNFLVFLLFSFWRARRCIIYMSVCSRSLCWVSRG